MAASNYIFNVAVVGAGGNVGRFITEALLKTGKHTVTAITRVDSQNKIPDGAISRRVEYDKPETLVEALRGQDALVITPSGQVYGKNTQSELLKAAAQADVPWILPNEWSPDTANEALIKDISVFPPNVAARQIIADLGKSSYIAVSTGFWYEWSLAIPTAYGIDIANRTATFFDEGETKISTSTWPQIGRAVAALLSLPIKPNSSNDGNCLEKLANKMVYISSFTVSQKEMLESVLRVTGTKQDEWVMTKESSSQRYTTGMKEIQEGKRIGFAKMLYTRIFFPDGSGDTEHGKGTLNEMLGLPEEDIDEASKAAMKRLDTNPWDAQK